jgi:glucose-6-phosphate isomerase
VHWTLPSGILSRVCFAVIDLLRSAFATLQPDALAVGKSAAELKHDGCPEALIPHRTMPGNRPSSVILLPKLGAYETGACFLC